MAALSARTAFVGSSLQQQARLGRSRVATQTVAAVKKVNSYDEDWTKGERPVCSARPGQEALAGAGGQHLHPQTPNCAQ